VFEAETLGWSKGIATAKIAGASAEFGTTAPNLVVTDIDNGDWTGLSHVAFGDKGAASVTVKVKPAQAGGSIQVRAGSETGAVLGTIPVTGTVGQWTELTAPLEGATGTKDVFFTYSGPSGDLFELDTYAFTAAPEEPTLDVTAVASTRCVAGKAVVAVQATNGEAVPVALSVSSSYGSKSVAALEAGKSTAQAFTTRLVSVPAGSASVQASATVDGKPVTVTVEAPYAAHSCG
jgi:arabinoxylan arabinofuranohydrolase